MEANALQNRFYEHVKSGSLKEAEEVAAALVELMLLRRDLGQGVSDAQVAAWQARQSLLQLML